MAHRQLRCYNCVYKPVHIIYTINTHYQKGFLVSVNNNGIQSYNTTCKFLFNKSYQNSNTSEIKTISWYKKYTNHNKQETAEDGKAGLSAIWPWKSTNQGQGQSNHRNQ